MRNSPRFTFRFMQFFISDIVYFHRNSLMFVMFYITLFCVFVFPRYLWKGQIFDTVYRMIIGIDEVSLEKIGLSSEKTGLLNIILHFYYKSREPYLVSGLSGFDKLV